uniref:Ricin B lectin domain-containing protein n=1 Tax=Trieres chinensis TaxID=1514140 RepID=A0A7S2AAL2_TRICV|mmetsp:Transcript_9530/g.20164  ORF Transcript_9530/g.20164 Transcript_9530/m.20164 type:complete len:157 (+) Transcript_9530:79-549(+)|eukprot:CAMPEP_0183322564 /NCGR_PEP_ID=MMETSP0160_2-20130417/71994_1 /TAXON_ID=2839 ORGANISM="Odontella Sinensis, Strain Grunow 1884" /NCGR_SAMPLE_ID=MMETSP0160_2 /ASSEMBLY_ACC=CAM_ASM_000250 /LENGTH=156 /DNA_ID=CAMNT_0025489755 /DNA_START=72 /DNA_END=542 /DNA_ORIENTATION=+
MKLSSIVALSATTLLVVKLDIVGATNKWKLIKSKEDDHLCMGVSKVNNGGKLELVRCDDGDDDQMWDLDNGKLKIKEDDDYCVEARAKKNKILRLRKCRNTRKQKWRYNENHDDEWTPRSDDDLCVGYRSGGDPDKGNQLALMNCNGEKEQGWKWD